MNASTFPDGFLWGAATAGHQVEGNNINTESWVLEHLPGTAYAEPSGDACDHYHRYPEDIALLAGLGFNAYRFSIEWARIEPEEGEFSLAALDHYRRMLAACHEHGIRPVVTLNHFISPRWLMAHGGWLDDGTPDRFARYCERVVAHLGDLITVAATVNEPNIAALLSRILPFRMEEQEWWSAAARVFGVTPERLGLFQFVTNPHMREVILAAHERACEVLRAGPGDFPVGLTIALPDVQSVDGGAELAAEFRRDIAGIYLERLHDDDYVGVQNYGRMVIGPEGIVRPSEDAVVTQSGEEFYPRGIEGAIDYASCIAGLPVYVTENGIATEDDSLRVDFYRQAVSSVANSIAAGHDVRGYFCWSAFDNFEWVSGYAPKFGIIGVDRETQVRTPKPSARFMGEVSKANGLPAPGITHGR